MLSCQSVFSEPESEVKAGAKGQSEAVWPLSPFIHSILTTRLPELTWLQPQRPRQVRRRGSSNWKSTLMWNTSILDGITTLVCFSRASQDDCTRSILHGQNEMV